MILHYWHNEIKELTPLLSITCFHLSEQQFIENIQPSLLSQVNPVNVHLVTATGETSPFIGQINVQISLGKKFYEHNVLPLAIISVFGGT
jgi:hypothetical protein